MSEISRPGRLERPVQSLAGGRYVISGVLGAGGMATVFRAFDSRLELYRAVKILNPELVSSPSLRKRFEMEARTMARLIHQNIVSVMDIGVEDELAYMVMELLEGGSLNDRIKNVGYLPPRTALAAVQAILSALVLAHNKGVIHRDIKPHNVLLTADGTLKLTDFGIAHLIGQDKALTASNAVIGTWAFMAPEQRKSSRRVSVATDIYSVGATLYALLTARDPFDIYNKELQKELFAGIPEPIVEIIERATRYYSDERYATAAEMLSAVQRVDAAIRPDFVEAPSRVLPIVELASSPGADGAIRVVEAHAYPTLANTDHATPIPVPSPTLFPMGDANATVAPAPPPAPSPFASDPQADGAGIAADEEPTPFDLLRQQGDPGQRLRRAALRNASPAGGAIPDPVGAPAASIQTTPPPPTKPSDHARHAVERLLAHLGPERWLLVGAAVILLLWVVVLLFLRSPTEPPLDAATAPPAATQAAPAPSAPTPPAPTVASPARPSPVQPPPTTPTIAPTIAPASPDAPGDTPQEQDKLERLRALPGQ